MLFFTRTNYDQTEGRGWEVPTGFYTTENCALWNAYKHKPFYNRPQDINIYDTKNDGFFGQRFFFGFDNSFFGDESKTAEWKNYLQIVKDEHNGEPYPPANPGELPLFALVRFGEGRIGTTTQKDVPYFDFISFNHKEVTELFSDKALDETTRYQLITLTANRHYGLDIFKQAQVLRDTRDENIKREHDAEAQTARDNVVKKFTA